jgi:hypothetical protein
MPVPAMPALTDTLLTWALWYAELDWPIFPAHTPTAQGCSCLHTATCTSPGKHPRLTGWQKRATTDPAMIQKWWGEMWPTANVALATGHTCWVLDVDCAAAVRGDLTLEALTHTHGPLPETPLVHSGGGGFHHFFQLPTTGIIGNAVKFLPGLDTRGEGGLIVLPPSQHASGRPYMWDSEHDLETTPLAPAPDWLLAMIQSPQDSAQVHGVPDAPILEPGRNNTLSRMAFHMRTSGMAIAEIVIALSAVIWVLSPIRFKVAVRGSVSPVESLRPPCLHLLTKVHTVPCAGDYPQARSVPASTVQLGQDRLSGVRVSRAIRESGRYRRLQITVCP